jgi:methenyltetrahydrofolate cyclohydrolase
VNDPTDRGAAAELSLLDVKVGDLLERLGSADPTPGGGAAAALAGALGAALVQMTANLTLDRPRYADVQDQARRLVSQAGDLRADLQRLADADASAYAGVTAAYRLPREDDAQRAARSAAIQQALVGAARVPLEVASACAEVLAVCQTAAPVLNASVISDVMVGALLAHAGLEAAAVNVEVNLASMTDAAAAEEIGAALARARAGAPQVLHQTLEAADSRIARRNRG